MVILALAAMILGLFKLTEIQEREHAARCAEWMGLARSPRDSLMAAMACEKLKTDAANAAALAFAAGLIAGSR